MPFPTIRSPLPLGLPPAENSFNSSASSTNKYHRSDTLWSPDSTKLVLSGQPLFGEMGIWIYNPTIEEKVFVDEGELAFWSWK